MAATAGRGVLGERRLHAKAHISGASILSGLEGQLVSAFGARPRAAGRAGDVPLHLPVAGARQHAARRPAGRPRHRVGPLSLLNHGCDAAHQLRRLLRRRAAAVVPRVSGRLAASRGLALCGRIHLAHISHLAANPCIYAVIRFTTSYMINDGRGTQLGEMTLHVLEADRVAATRARLRP